MGLNEDEKRIRQCIAEGKKALSHQDIPIGCIIVDEEGKVVAKAHNQREKSGIPTAHAEILAINKAGKKRNNWNLSGCTLYVSLEPCVMCAGAIINSRISKVVFGAYDIRFGCSGSVYNLLQDEKFNHRCEVKGGIIKEECIKPIQDFFADLRKNKKSLKSE